MTTSQLNSSEYYEQVFLAALLHGKIQFSKYEDRVKPEYFTGEIHKHIYLAMQVYVDKLKEQDFDAETFIQFPSLIQYMEWNKALFPYALNLITSIPENFSLAMTLNDIVELLKIKFQIRKSQGILEDGINSLHLTKNINHSIGEIEKNLNEVIEEKTSTVSTLSMSLKSVINLEIEKLKENKNTFVASGFADFDHIYGGFRPSDLIILAARPGMGKTALATKIALNIAKRGTGVGFISLEMSKEQIAGRILTLESNVSANKGLKFGLTQQEIERHLEVDRNLNELPFFISDTSGCTLDEIRKKCFQLKKLHNIGIVIVDYLQIIQTSGRFGESRVNLVGEISSGLKGLAKSLNLPVIALSQLSRSVESRLDKHPILSDLRDSGSIEQDADVVMFLYRGEYYTPNDLSLKGKAELTIAKHRHDVLSKIGLNFVASTTDFI